MQHDTGRIDAVEAGAVPVHFLPGAGHVGNHQVIGGQDALQVQQFADQQRAHGKLGEQFSLAGGKAGIDVLSGEHGFPDGHEPRARICYVRCQVGDNESNRVGGFDIALDAQGNRHHGFQRLSRNSPRLLQVAAQCTCTHRQNRVVECSAQGLSNCTNTLIGPALRGESPRACYIAADDAAWDRVPGNVESRLAADPDLPVLEQRASKVGAAAQLAGQAVRQRLDVTFADRGAGNRRGDLLLVLLPRFTRQR
jgi:hypothetical protein